MTQVIKFKANHTFEKRKAESKRIRNKYVDRIPVIVEVEQKTLQTSPKFKLDKKKYLVPDDLTIGQFCYVIRKRIKLEPSEAVFMFVITKNNKHILPVASSLISQINSEQCHDDGFLYFRVSGESTFG